MMTQISFYRFFTNFWWNRWMSVHKLLHASNVASFTLPNLMSLLRGLAGILVSVFQFSLLTGWFLCLHPIKVLKWHWLGQCNLNLLSTLLEKCAPFPEVLSAVLTMAPSNTCGCTNNSTSPVRMSGSTGSLALEHHELHEVFSPPDSTDWKSCLPLFMKPSQAHHPNFHHCLCHYCTSQPHSNFSLLRSPEWNSSLGWNNFASLLPSYLSNNLVSFSPCPEAQAVRNST